MINQQLISNQYRLSQQLLTRVGITLLVIGFMILSLNYFCKIADSKQQIRNQAQSITDSVGLMITELVDPNKTDDLIPILQQLSRLPTVIQVVIITPEGQILTPSGPNLTQQQNHFGSGKMQSYIKKASQTQEAVSFSSKVQNQPVFVYLSPIKSLTVPSRIIVAILDLQPLQQQAGRIFLISVLLLIGECMMILILIGLLLRQAILTPLNQLYQSLQQYQKGNTLEFAEQLSVNKIGALAKAIYQQFIDLKQTNAQLKIEVVERKNAEAKIQASLQEKELLLREIHHRVKNNLFIVSQIIDIQIDYLDDLQLTQVLRDCQERIYSMVLIHETLYKTTNLKNIDFADYVQSLIAYLNQSYNSRLNSSVEIQLKLQPIILNVETANPCGLIINELVSNAFKHAFKNEKKGIIKVTLTQDANSQICLKIQDNGIGFPENLDFQQVDSLGLELVRTLTQQLQGDLELDCSQGTLFKLTFTELNYNKC